MKHPYEELLPLDVTQDVDPASNEREWLGKSNLSILLFILVLVGSVWGGFCNAFMAYGMGLQCDRRTCEVGVELLGSLAVLSGFAIAPSAIVGLIAIQRQTHDAPQTTLGRLWLMLAVLFAVVNLMSWGLLFLYDPSFF